MVEQIKIEKKRATAYTPAKNRMGCRAPTGLTVFLLIIWILYTFSKVFGFSSYKLPDTRKIVLMRIKIFPNLG